MKYIGLCNSKERLIVDDEDYDKLSTYSWRLTCKKTVTTWAYYGQGVVIPIRKTASVPDIIFDVDKSVDSGKIKLISYRYKNGNRLDNRKDNIVVRHYDPKTGPVSKLFSCNGDFKLAINDLLETVRLEFRPNYDIIGKKCDFALLDGILLHCCINVHNSKFRSLLNTLSHFRKFNSLPIVLVTPNDVSIRSDLRRKLPRNTHLAQSRDLTLRIGEVLRGTN